MDAENYDWHAHIERAMLNPNTTQEDMKEVYSGWSKKYEKIMVQDYGYKGHVVAAKLFAQQLKEFGYSNDVRILDLGCGTGLVGEQLWKHGYKNIDGVDLTPELLEIAKAKGIYSSLKQGIIGSPQCKELGVEANQYDVAICVGVFSLKHVTSKGFDDLVHVVKPGGLACCSMREQALNAPDSTYEERMEQFCKDGKWKLIVKHHEPAYLKHDGAWFFVYQLS